MAFFQEILFFFLKVCLKVGRYNSILTVNGQIYLLTQLRLFCVGFILLFRVYIKWQYGILSNGDGI